MTQTQSSGTTLKPQQIAEAFHNFSKQARSQTGTTGSGSQQSPQSRHEFDTWFNGFESCLKMVGEQETGSSIPTPNRNEIYTLVEKQQKAA